MSRHLDSLTYRHTHNSEKRAAASSLRSKVAVRRRYAYCTYFASRKHFPRTQRQSAMKKNDRNCLSVCISLSVFLGMIPHKGYHCIQLSFSNWTNCERLRAGRHHENHARIDASTAKRWTLKELAVYCCNPPCELCSPTNQTMYNVRGESEKKKHESKWCRFRFRTLYTTFIRAGLGSHQDRKNNLRDFISKPKSLINSSFK